MCVLTVNIQIENENKLPSCKLLYLDQVCYAYYIVYSILQCSIDAVLRLCKRYTDTRVYWRLYIHVQPLFIL